MLSPKKKNILVIIAGRKNVNSGFTLVEILIVAAIISLLAAIAIPNYIQSRAAAQTQTCISNLRQISDAIQQWAMENKKLETDTVDFSDIRPYLKGPVACPAGGTSFADSYLITKVSEPPACIRVPISHLWMPSSP